MRVTASIIAGVMILATSSLLPAHAHNNSIPAGDQADYQRRRELAEKEMARRLAISEMNPKENVEIRDWKQKRDQMGNYQPEVSFTIRNYNPAPLRQFTLKCETESVAAQGNRKFTWTQGLDGLLQHAVVKDRTVPAGGSRGFSEIKLRSTTAEPLRVNCEIDTATFDK